MGLPLRGWSGTPPVSRAQAGASGPGSPDSRAESLPRALLSWAPFLHLCPQLHVSWPRLHRARRARPSPPLYVGHQLVSMSPRWSKATGTGAFQGGAWSPTAKLSSTANTGAPSHSHRKGPSCLVPAQQLGSFRNLKRKQLSGQCSMRDAGGRGTASPLKFRKRQSFTASSLPPPRSSSLPALCFPRMKTVNLFYLFQSILGSVPLRAEAAMVTPPTRALKIHSV